MDNFYIITPVWVAKTTYMCSYIHAGNDGKKFALFSQGTTSYKLPKR